MVADFERDWAAVRVVEASESLVRRAGDLAQRFGLHGYDSVHLAAAEAVWRALPGVDYRVGVFDGRLAEAARGLGMVVMG
ncbi:type II toxin-antitoxin system VapC family toxin [Methylomagnum sp.]